MVIRATLLRGTPVLMTANERRSWARSMDMIAVDITTLNDIHVGTACRVWELAARRGNRALRRHDPYELLCGSASGYRWSCVEPAKAPFQFDEKPHLHAGELITSFIRQAGSLGANSGAVEHGKRSPCLVFLSTWDDEVASARQA